MSISAHRVIKSATHQKLQGKIVSTFGCLASIVELGCIPVDLEKKI